MSSVRRRVLRPVPSEPSRDPAATARQARQRARLAKERTSLKRWLTKLKRATNTVTALFQSISRLEAKLGS
jgi:hypothetical protein